MTGCIVTVQLLGVSSNPGRFTIASAISALQGLCGDLEFVIQLDFNSSVCSQHRHNFQPLAFNKTRSPN